MSLEKGFAGDKSVWEMSPGQNCDPPSYKGYGQIGGDSEEKLEERKVSREEIIVYL